MEHIIVPESADFESRWHFSHAVRAGDLLFVTGVTGVGPDGDVADDPSTQFRRAFDQLGQSLAAAGAGYPDIVEITTYHVGLRQHLDAFTAVKDEYLTRPYPAWTAIGVAELIAPGALAELRAIAVS